MTWQDTYDVANGMGMRLATAAEAKQLFAERAGRTSWESTLMLMEPQVDGAKASFNIRNVAIGTSSSDKNWVVAGKLNNGLGLGEAFTSYPSAGDDHTVETNNKVSMFMSPCSWNAPLCKAQGKYVCDETLDSANYHRYRGCQSTTTTGLFC